MFLETKAKYLLLSTIFLTLVSSFFLIPYEDSYYYWEWSRHLGLSYFDGPPMIAYLLRIFTLIFGETTFAINLLGVASIILTVWFIYLMADLLFDKRVAICSSLLWILSTPVIHYLFLWVTYDNPLNVAWAATMYFSVRFIQFKKTLDLYWIGICAGLLILSKYTGVILLITLAIFVVSTKYRSLFKNMHFYFGSACAIFVMSPVLFWNMKHEWLSFSFLFSHHVSTHSFHLETLINFVLKLIKHFDFLIFIPIYAIFKERQYILKNDSILLLNYIFIVFIIFFMVFSLKNSISKHLLTPLTIPASILTAYLIVKYDLKKLWKGIIIWYGALCIYYVTVNCFFQKYFDEEYFLYPLIHTVGEKYLNQHQTIITSDWLSAAKLSFWLPNKPYVQTIHCGKEHHYTFWKKVNNKNVLYLDFHKQSSCVKEYLLNCEHVETLKHIGHNYPWGRMPTIELNAYFCRT